MIGIGLSNSAPSSSDSWTITPDELRIPLRKCCLCAQFKCYPSPRSYSEGQCANPAGGVGGAIIHTSLCRRQPARVITMKTGDPINLEDASPHPKPAEPRDYTQYREGENVALGLVPSLPPAGRPVALVPPDPINREAMQQHQEIYLHRGTMYNSSMYNVIVTGADSGAVLDETR